MQQVIYLEAGDLVEMKTGRTLTLTVGGASLMLGYMGKTYKKNGKAKPVVEDVEATKPRRKRHMPWMGGKKGKRSRKACGVCGKMIKLQGIAPHMAMHRRNSEVAK